MDSFTRIISPQFILQSKLKQSIGKAPNVYVCPVYEEEDIWHIDIIVKSKRTAKALATLLRKQHTVGSITVKITVYQERTMTPIEPEAIAEGADLKALAAQTIQTTLGRNPYFVKVLPEPTIPVVDAVAILFAPTVIQYFSGDITTSGYTTEVAADVFDSLIDKGVFSPVALFTDTVVVDDFKDW